MGIIRKESIYDRTNNILIAVYLFNIIFLPVDQFNLKLLSLMLLFAFNISSIIVNVMKDRIMLLGCVLLPLLIFIFSFVNDGTLPATISAVYLPVSALIIFPVLTKKLRFTDILFALLKLQVILTVGIVILDIAGMIDVNSHVGIRKLFYDYQIGFMGRSEWYASYYKVFFKTSPVLILLLDRSWDEKKYVWSALTVAAMVISGTRANLFIAVGYTVIRALFDEASVNKQIKWLFAVIAAFFSIQRITEIISSIMNKKGSVESDAVKTSQFSSLMSCLKDPFLLLLGDGFGSVFFDEGKKLYTDTAELAYLNLLRQTGIICFMIFIVFIGYPLLCDIKKSFKLAYTGYLLIAFTNPLLYSSTAFIVYMYAYIKVYTSRQVSTSDQGGSFYA